MEVPSMAEEIFYGRCAKCGGPLVAGHECSGTFADFSKAVAKAVVETANMKPEEERIAAVVAEIRRIAKTVGWAIGEHGTRVRDVDLIAVPWDGQACSRDALLGEILKATKAICTAVNPKPHGRVGFILQGYGPKMIDLSCFQSSGGTERG
jgi:hypothetical protein